MELTIPTRLTAKESPHEVRKPCHISISRSHGFRTIDNGSFVKHFHQHCREPGFTHFEQRKAMRNYCGLDIYEIRTASTIFRKWRRLCVVCRQMLGLKRVEY